MRYLSKEFVNLEAVYTHMSSLKNIKKENNIDKVIFSCANIRTGWNDFVYFWWNKKGKEKEIWIRK